jgi:hypothetical protein
MRLFLKGFRHCGFDFAQPPKSIQTTYRLHAGDQRVWVVESCHREIHID